jgi:primosomal protein N' (replication factor Y)
VTLVVVLGLDSTLNLPDFSAPERTFQLLTQVAGRAGRGGQKGEVWVQTAFPDHYAIQSAIHHDVWAFYQHEIAFRDQLQYPPFSKLIHMIFSSPNKKAVETTAKTFASLIPQDESYTILGPAPAPLEKVQNVFRWHLLLKIKPDAFESAKHMLTRLPKSDKSVKVFYDFSPKSLL